MNIRSWVDWCAVIGCAISVFLAVRELWLHRIHFKLFHPIAVFVREAPLLLVLRLTITNCSRSSSSLHSAYLVGRDGQKFMASKDAVSCLSV
ncbi:MAG: hypothetical protein RSC06_08410, partial [Clostridia bacterium]